MSREEHFLLRQLEFCSTFDNLTAGRCVRQDMEKGSFRLAMRVPGGWKVYESFSSEAEIDRKLARLAHRPEVEYVAHGPSWVGARYRLTAAARRAVESLAQLAPAPPGLPETS